MTEKEVDNRMFLGSVCLILVVILLLWSVSMYEVPVDNDEHHANFVVSNGCSYNVSIEMYVVTLEYGGSANMTANTTSGGWDYLMFEVPVDGQVNVTLKWFGNSNAVTVFVLHTIDYEGYEHTTISRMVVDEKTTYVDFLMD
jgi:hypothetical protein